MTAAVGTRAGARAVVDTAVTTAAAARVQSETFRPFEAYILVAVAYLLLSLLMRAGLWLFGQAVFTRRHRLGAAR